MYVLSLASCLISNPFVVNLPPNILIYLGNLLFNSLIIFIQSILNLSSPRDIFYFSLLFFKNF